MSESASSQRGMSESAPPERYLEIDVLKAVAILAVVLIHSLRPPWDASAPAIEVWLGNITRFAVPSFLFASGFLYATRERVERSLTLRRLRRILLPYLVASIGAQLYRYAQGDVLTAGSVAADLLLGGSFGPYYYVFQIFILILLTPLFAWVSRTSAAMLASLVGVSILLQFVIDQGHLFELSVRAYTRNPLVWWCYFLLGWCVRLRYRDFRSWLDRRRSVATAGFAAATCVFALLIWVLPSESPVRAATLLSTYSIIGTLVVATAGARGVPPSVRTFSDASYTIFLFHLFFVLPLASLLRAPGELVPMALVLPWMTGIAGSLALVFLARKLFGERSRDIVGA